MERIYLDYIASTPTDKRVVAAMQSFHSEKFGNASSTHSYGQEARIAVDEARDTIAGFFGARSSEVYFTGTATEACNWAIRGVIEAQIAKGKKPEELHVISSTIEHKAVLETLKYLQSRGLRVTLLNPDNRGIVSVESAADAITDATVLVSLMYVNNEVGSIQPISGIGSLVRRVRADRRSRGGDNQIPLYLHTDAVQAVQFLDCTRESLDYDLLTFSGHKIYGPKGIGGLVVQRDIEIAPLIYGGGQEAGLRSGTENVPGIVGLGMAFELLQTDEHKRRSEEIATMRDNFITICDGLDGVELNGPRGIDRIHNNVNISVASRDSESLVIGLDLKGIAVSAGSACSAGALEPSYVLKAMGLGNERAKSAIRISLGRYTKQKELNSLINTLKEML